MQAKKLYKPLILVSMSCLANAEDLAKLAHVNRDPRFETFRISYVKGDEIVGHEDVIQNRKSRPPSPT